ncbi:MAG: DUF2235 domain-containing protein [Nocardioidaceae bacterium]
MKRLVVCCDGTWNKPDSAHITNIEKIARTIQTDPSASGGVQQLVLYVGGVGIGYKLDQLLGGAFGSGLFNNVKTAYRFLALNYEEGDEIFVFGFSRGAYTARSLVGMIGYVGLLTRRSVIADKLPEAVTRYQRKQPAAGAFGASNEEFKRDFCHADIPTKFIGVFDTVGALGVPGMLPKDHQFHDINLGDSVQCARQALAIDEQRMVFAPCLWEAPERPEDPDRVKQVWFEGAHSDVGGGYGETGLSDTALLWMASEANQRGLVFDRPLLDSYIAGQSPAIRHNSLRWFYRISNLRKRMLSRRSEEKSLFVGQRRNLCAPGSGVRLSSAARSHYFDAEKDYRPRNLDLLVESRDPEVVAASTEPVIALPEVSVESISARLEDAGVYLDRARQVVPEARSATMSGCRTTRTGSTGTTSTPRPTTR